MNKDSLDQYVCYLCSNTFRTNDLWPTKKINNGEADLKNYLMFGLYLLTHSKYLTLYRIDFSLQMLRLTCRPSKHILNDKLFD